MRTRISIEAYAARLLAVLSLAPMALAAGCEGSVDDDGEGGPGVPCENPQPLVEGQDTGYQRCASGALHRPLALECTSHVPRQGETCSGEFGGECTTDADCTAQPNGWCGSGFDSGCACRYGCTADADCGDGQICLCGDPVGACVTAACTTDADCGGGTCTTYVTDPGCGGLAFACSTPLDQCAGDGDCEEGEQCTLEGGHRVCVEPQCAIGRPFLVAGDERVAEVARRGDWCADAVHPDLGGLSDEQRAVLRDHWTRTAQMEHASVAAFARFVLQLLSQGAPPDLIQAAQEAMRDETEHARLCFALASAYGSAPLGPAALALDGALDDADARSILIGTILEGCIGETVAAIEAAEGAAHAADPAVRAVLARIADDEARHAELAWRYVAWALREGDRDLCEAARETFERALAVSGAGPAGDAAQWLRLGRVTEGLRADLRRQALARVIGPCARSLLSRERSGFQIRELAADS